MIQDEALNEKTTQETQFGIQMRSSGIGDRTRLQLCRCGA
jgi:hypothetical protein